MGLTLLAMLLALSGSLAEGQTLGDERNDRPLYEVGVGAAVFQLPDYPGSDQSRVRTLGLPYAIYRGRYLRADEDGGVRGRFFDLENWDLDLAAGAAFPANSEENEAREGMPDQDWIGRVGPRLRYRILEKDARDRFWLNLPVQTVFSTDFGRLDGRGFVFLPSLQYDYRGFLDGRLRVVASVAGVYATRPLMDYFYTVPKRFAIEGRRAYSAREGFLEMRYRLGVIWSLSPDYILAASFGLNSLEWARNQNSPLLRQEVTTTAVVGLIWRVFASTEKAYR
ncbi:MAG: MipA/OmpV family protein [Bdellovibrionales bacterium]|nr:MipA/OmpV family protein [Bdellovibrionales bacterium]